MTADMLPMAPRFVDSGILGRLEPIRALSPGRLRELSALCTVETGALGMDPFNFADTLLDILAQRLAKRLCKSCKEAYQPAPEEIKHLISEYCEDLANTDNWKKDPPAAATIHDEWLRQGMRTLKMDGLEKVMSGITDIKQVRSVCIK